MDHQKQSADDRLGFIEKKIDLMISEQATIKSWIAGDKENKLNPGALEEIAILKAKISRFEKLVIKVIGIAIGMSIAAGVGIGRIMELLNIHK